MIILYFIIFLFLFVWYDPVYCFIFHVEFMFFFHRKRLKGNVHLEEEAYKTSHVLQYESKLLSLEARRHRKRHTTSCATPQRRKTGKTPCRNKHMEIALYYIHEIYLYWSIYVFSLPSSGRRPLPSLTHNSENEEADEGEERGPQGKQKHTMSLAHTDPQPTLLEKHQNEEHFPARVSKPKVDLLHILQQGWDLRSVWTLWANTQCWCLRFLNHIFWLIFGSWTLFRIWKGLGSVKSQKILIY